MLLTKLPLSSYILKPALRHSGSSASATFCTHSALRSNSSDASWPPSHPPPTPYQILAASPARPYTKARFTELVKLYHPDREPHAAAAKATAHLDAATKLERYHLIVAAHVLLSDPAKKSAYDRYGIGWVDAPLDDLMARAAAAGGTRAHGAHANATWEDWERWRQEREQEQEEGEFFKTSFGQKRPEERFMSHARFYVLLMLFTTGAATAQGLHAGNVTEARRLIREENHWKAEKDWQDKVAATRKRTKEDRLEAFLRQRDPAVLKNPALAKMIMDPDTCDPESRTAANVRARIQAEG